jgi:hypothetical protein
VIKAYLKLGTFLFVSICDLDLEEEISSIAITIHLTQTPQTQTGSLLNARGDRYQEGPLF